MKRYTPMLVLLALLSGCSTTTTFYVDPMANFGPKPTNVEAVAKRYFGPSLKDADTAMYNVMDPIQCVTNDVIPSFAIPPLYGWCTVVNINARNSFGAFTGWKSYHLFMNTGYTHHMFEFKPGEATQAGKSVQILGGPNAGCVGGGLVSERC